MNSNVEGMVIEVICEQPSNALSPIEVSPSGNINSVIGLLWKLPKLPPNFILLNVLGKCIDENWHYAKHDSGISTTPSGIISSPLNPHDMKQPSRSSWTLFKNKLPLNLEY